MGARGVNAVLSLVYLALATRALGLEGFGQFILCVMFAQVITGLANFQTWQSIIRWGQERDSDQGEDVGIGRDRVTGFAIALDGVTIVSGLIAGALLLFFAGDWLPIPDELRLATFGFTLVSLLSIRSTPTGILRLHDLYARAAAADATTSMVRAPLALVAAFIMPSVEGFLAVWAAAELATAAVYWLFACRVQRPKWSTISLTRLPSAEAGAWKFVIGTSLSASLLVVSRQVLVLLVGALGGAALAGVYRVAAQLGEGLLKLAQALLRATYPELVRDPEAAQAIAARITRIAVFTGLAAVVLSALFGKWVILAIASEAYLAAYVPMIVLSGAAALDLSGASLEALLVARGRAVTNFFVRAIPTLLAFAILPLLIARSGAEGAAACVLLASVLTLVGLVFFNRKPVEPETC